MKPDDQSDPNSERITMAHGSGGRAMHRLVDELFLPAFGTEPGEDQARVSDDGLKSHGARLAFTTDAFVVEPLEFPGGDIGRISVCGTVNDLVVGGARPLWLSAAFVLEEGCELALLRRIVTSMRCAGEEAGVRIVTGDTKVVGKGAADQVFITTSGIGVIPPGRELSSGSVEADDVVIVNGAIGDHGATILAARGELALDTDIRSDCQSLRELMERVFESSDRVRTARDATRGGLATTLNEIAQAAKVGIEIEQARIPIRNEVRGVCEILGLDPLYLANEGTLALFVPESDVAAVLEAMRSCPAGRDAVAIGHAYKDATGIVTVNTEFGGRRVIDMLAGDQFPRIC